MALTWYEYEIVCFGEDRIVSVEIDRFTDHSVWIRGERFARLGWRNFFPTPDDAKRWAIEQARWWVGRMKEKLADAQSELDFAESRLAQRIAKYGDKQP